MHPEAPAAPPTATPAPPDAMQTLAATLDSTMEMAAIAANSQRDEEAGIPSPEVERQEAQTVADDDEELEDEEGAEATPAEPSAPEAEAAATTPGEPPKYSRRDAARFAADLEARTREVTEAREIAARAQAELNGAKAADQHILTQLAEISGYTREANGQFRYDNLRDKAVRGTATDDERREVAEMTQWHELAGPIYRQAEVQVTRAFSVDWNALKDLDGVGNDGLRQLNQAPNGVAGARAMHALAYQAGQKAAKAESDATIARLKAENKSLRTGAVARSPQPAVAGGIAVPSSGGFRDKAFKADGTINEEFDREVRAGKWLGVDLANS